MLIFLFSLEKRKKIKGWGVARPCSKRIIILGVGVQGVIPARSVSNENLRNVNLPQHLHAKIAGILT